MLSPEQREVHAYFSVIRVLLANFLLSNPLSEGDSPAPPEREEPDWLAIAEGARPLVIFSLGRGTSLVLLVSDYPLPVVCLHAGLGSNSGEAVTAAISCLTGS